MVSTIAELPFAERPVLELLHLEDEDRREPDPDYAGFGWARVPRVELAGAGGGVVEHALLLALHSADDGEARSDDVELEFVLPAPSDGSVTVLLSAFLARWLPRLGGDQRAIVLVMCNPHRATLRVTAPVPVHYGLGDVESWLADGALRLTADAWRTT
jgi:hypothetical protein